MNLSFSTIVHIGSVPTVLTGDSVSSSPRCVPCSGTIQPSICALLGPPWTSITNAWVLALSSLAGAAVTGAAPCAQYGHWSHVLSIGCSHCEQIRLAQIQNPLVMIGGFGLETR